MTYEIRLEKYKHQPLAVVRRRAKQQELSTVVPAACGAVWNVLRSQKVTGAGRHVAFYLGGPAPRVGKQAEAAAAGKQAAATSSCDDSESLRPGEMKLEVGVELANPFGGHGEVIDSALPAGPVAATTYYGPYQQLYKAHEAVREWCKRNGRKLAGPSWEIYGHWEEAWNTDPSKIRTDVYYLLA